MKIRTALTTAGLGLTLLLGAACDIGLEADPPAPETSRSDASTVFTDTGHTPEEVECLVDVLFAPDVPAEIRNHLVEANRGNWGTGGQAPFSMSFPEGTSEEVALAVGTALDACHGIGPDGWPIGGEATVPAAAAVFTDAGFDAPLAECIAEAIVGSDLTERGKSTLISLIPYVEDDLSGDTDWVLSDLDFEEPAEADETVAAVEACAADGETGPGGPEGKARGRTPGR